MITATFHYTDGSIRRGRIDDHVDLVIVRDADGHEHQFVSTGHLDVDGSIVFHEVGDDGPSDAH